MTEGCAAASTLPCPKALIGNALATDNWSEPKVQVRRVTICGIRLLMGGVFMVAIGASRPGQVKFGHPRSDLVAILRAFRERSDQSPAFLTVSTPSSVLKVPSTVSCTASGS